MSRALLVTMMLVVTACGVQRPLMRPSEVQAHEEKRAKEMQQREADRKAEEQRQQLLQPITPQ